MGEDNKVIGIDIGGTKVHIGLVQDGKVLEEVRLSTSAHAPQEQIITELINGIEQVMEPGVAGIGIGVPGLIDEENGVVHNVQNIPSWREVYLKMHLEEYFKKPVCITNDANSFAAGEKMYGNGRSYKNMVGITLGTGFGTGIIIEDQVYAGRFSSAGEFGGIPYLDLTIEDYCSGKYFKRVHGMSGLKVQRLAEKGDASALAILQEYGHHLGNAIKVILYAISPDAIFLGGSVSGCYTYFKDAMLESVQSFPFKVVTDQLVIERSHIGNVAILGAVALFRMRNASSYVNTKAFV
ncbi:ROK family protein [Pontibacter sp. SGAir0037]|uniref:ROK family protein n=1 Tax=Pontibacter sp. SGAir0037 TaxID=2571030 RepID=UPI0010CCB2B2|nr:ROK family protein [Pontibacter sp. SGAir0037]QCR22264.1 sugar kinase [Pontibacter sp. SGAir0037]